MIKSFSGRVVSCFAIAEPHLLTLAKTDYPSIEDVHLLFCARYINIFTFLTGVELRHFFHPQCLWGA